MNPLKLFLLLVLYTNPFQAMDCFANRTFNKQPLSTEEKNKLLELLRTSQITLDENGNNVLHLAAAIQEWPDLMTQLLLVRPGLSGYMDAPNREGLTPRNLFFYFQNKARTIQSNTIPPLVTKNSQITIVRIPKQTIQQSIEELDKSITAKVTLFNQDLPYEPFTLTEKARILRIILDMPHPTGGTPLHGAVDFQGYPELTKDLLAFKPELHELLNVPDNLGVTPLKKAIIRNNWPAFSILMAAGAQENP